MGSGRSFVVSRSLGRPLRASSAAWLGLIAAATGLLSGGCGINKSRLATEQLVVSDAVDRTVATIDFGPLSGRKVYFDTQYLDGLNLGPNGNVKYVISSLRQQMLAYDCRLQEKAENADFVVEARVGVLANDGHEITYGIPGNAALGTASVLMASPVPIPALPELSLGRRSHEAGTAKIGVFAYDRKTGEPVWQSGVQKQSSEARDSWVLGLGPYQRRPKSPRVTRGGRRVPDELAEDPLAAYSSPIVFERAVRRSPLPAEAAAEVATASHEEPAKEPQPPQVITPAADARPVQPAQDPAK
jgi:hypothetical protein